MPAYDLQPRDGSLPRLGIIRLGIKKVSGNGNEYPVEADHFVLTDAPDVAKVYGPTPTQLLIYLTQPTVDGNLIVFHELWAHGYCRCRGNGQCIVDLRDPTGVEKIVHDGLALKDFDDEGNTIRAGKMVPCPGLTHDLYARCKNCRPSALLAVMIRDPNRETQLVSDRLGYYQIRSTSTINIRNLTGQLLYAQQIAGLMGRDLYAIPMILRRVQRPITFVSEDKDGVKRRSATSKYFLDLECDANWVRRITEEMRARALGEGYSPSSLPAEIMESEATEIIQDDDNGKVAPDNSAPTQIKTGGRPYDAETVRKGIQKRVARNPMAHKKAATEKQRGYIVMLFNEAFADSPTQDKDRHACTLWLINKVHAKEYSAAEAGAIIEWLTDEQGNLDQFVKIEAHNVLRQALSEQGQMDVFEDPPSEDEQADLFEQGQGA